MPKLNISLECDHGTLSTFTDEDGRFTFSGLPAERVWLKGSRSGDALQVFMRSFMPADFENLEIVVNP